MTMLNNHILGVRIFRGLIKYSLNFGNPFGKHKTLTNDLQFSNYFSSNCSGLKISAKSYSLLRQQKTYFQLLERTHSTLLQFDSEKVEKYLKNINEDILHTQFKLTRDEPVFDLLKDKALYEENLQQTIELKGSLEQLKSLKESEGKSAADEREMLVLVEEDIIRYTAELNGIYEKIIVSLLPKEELEDCSDVVLEISPGVGGLEAMLFATDMRDMYCNLLKHKGWEYCFAENDESELGGVRHCSLLVTGPGAFRILRHEAGTHRVQRVPATERAGRVHTSTVSVAVLPQPSDVEVNIKDSDLKIETKRAGGAGGQHVNTTDSAVRIVHIPTGIAVECQTGRNQFQNKATALKRIKAKIYDMEANQIDSNIRNQRKSQVGTSARSEKIRTYNYRDDRISDHRLSINVHNLKEFLEGGDSLEKLLVLLERWHHNHKVKKLIDDLPTLLNVHK